MTHKLLPSRFAATALLLHLCLLMWHAELAHSASSHKHHPAWGELNSMVTTTSHAVNNRRAEESKFESDWSRVHLMSRNKRYCSVINVQKEIQCLHQNSSDATVFLVKFTHSEVVFKSGGLYCSDGPEHKVVCKSRALLERGQYLYTLLNDTDQHHQILLKTKMSEKYCGTGPTGLLQCATSDQELAQPILWVLVQESVHKAVTNATDGQNTTANATNEAVNGILTNLETAMSNATEAAAANTTSNPEGRMNATLNATGQEGNATLNATGQDGNATLNDTGQEGKATLNATGQEGNATLNATDQENNATLNATGQEGNATLNDTGQEGKATLNATGQEGNTTLNATGQEGNATLEDREQAHPVSTAEPTREPTGLSGSPTPASEAPTSVPTTVAPTTVAPTTAAPTTAAPTTAAPSSAQPSDCVDEYTNLDCNGHGKCINDQCHCQHDWKGGFCGQPNCVNNCSGHGTCNPASGFCDCDLLFLGAGCEHRTPHYCPGNCTYPHGKCAGSQCQCQPGFQGVDCALRTPKSCPTSKAGTVCSSNGMCDRGKGQCTCLDGYSEHDCSRGCFKDCNGHGRCSEVTNMCECQEDGLGRPIWKGVSCEEKAAPCDLVDCGEHGVCHEDHHGKAQCQCSGGYTGARCDQISEDPDLRQPEDDQLTPKNSEKEGTTIVEKLRTWMTLAGVALGLMISLFMACRAYHKWKRVGYSQLSGGAIIGENGDQIQDDFYGL